MSRTEGWDRQSTLAARWGPDGGVFNILLEARGERYVYSHYDNYL